VTSSSIYTGVIDGIDKLYHYLEAEDETIQAKRSAVLRQGHSSSLRLTKMDQVSPLSRGQFFLCSWDGALHPLSNAVSTASTGRFMTGSTWFLEFLECLVVRDSCHNVSIDEAWAPAMPLAFPIHFAPRTAALAGVADFIASLRHNES
jgi:hypothetical protein